MDAPKDLIMRRDIFKDEALKESLRSSYKYLLGAVIVKRGKIVGKGYNSVAYQGKRSFLNGIHAEIAAINNTRAADRSGSTIYVARWMRRGQLGLAKPCPACEKVLRKLGIKKVYYSDYGNVWRKFDL